MTYGASDALAALVTRKIIGDHEGVSAFDSVQRAARVVMMKGVFDLFHLSHLKSLASAASMGDVLVVAVASDKSVRERKGADRPIFSWDERAMIIAALSVVTAVTSYDSYSPFQCIRAVKPDVFVASHFGYLTEVEKSALVGMGIELRVLKKPAGPSTTDIISRIKSDDANQGIL